MKLANLMENKYTILVAEDEDYNFKLLKYILEKEGINVLWAKNGLEAVEMFKENKNIDLVMMDIKMPVMTGIEAIVEIKQINNSIPSIAVTAYAMDKDKTKCLDAGFDAYVTKPVNRVELMYLTYKLLMEK